MQIKQPGVPVSLLVEALGAARTARLSLLATMSTALAAHTRRRGSTGPRMQTLQMSPDNVVGWGGVVLVQDLGQQLCFPHDCVHPALCALCSCIYMLPAGCDKAWCRGHQQPCSSPC